MRLLRCWLIALAATALLANPINHETMWLMKRVGSPAPSPDGKWVVFSVTEPSYNPEEQVSDLWIVPSNGSEEPRRLTSTKGSESGVDWSPDSKRIAFSAKREGDEKSQIYVLNIVGGGEAVRITELKMGASNPVWSPDGKRILFHSHVYPGAGSEQANKKADAERKDRKYEAHVYEGFPIRIWDRWLDETKMHLFVQDAKPGAEPKDLLAGTKLAAEPGFSPPSLQSADFGAVWAPDGQSIVFVATTNRNEAAHAEVLTHLFQVPASGGEPKLLSDGKNSYSSPAFRPDGKALYATYDPSTESVYDLDRLAVLSWPNPEKPRILTSNWDRSVGSFAFSPDSRSVYILAQESGHTKPFRIPADGGEVEPLIPVDVGTYSGLAIPSEAPETMLFASWQSSNSPSEVVRINPANRGHSNLTHFNKETLAGIDWEPEQHFWFTADDGRRVHNMLALPPNFDSRKKYPLVLFIHGGPHSMSADDFHLRWNVQMLASPGYVVLRTNYKGSTGFGEKFAQSIQGDPLRGPGDDINRAVDEAIQRYSFIDPTRIAAGGASYGGHLSNWLQATTTRYRCLYSHAGLISLEGQWATSDVIYHRERNNGGPYWEGGGVWKDQSPFRYAANFQTPVLLTIGVNDYRVPLNQTLAYWSVLQRRQVPSKLVVFPRANHWIMNGEDSRFFYQELLDWLEKHLRP